MSKLAVIFILTFLGCLFGAILIDAMYGIFIYEIVYFVNPKIRWWSGDLPDLRYSFVIAIVVLIAFLIRLKKYSENHIFDILHNRWLLALIILMWLISFTAVWPEKHISTCINILKVVFFVFLLYKIIDTPKKFEMMIWVFLIGSFYLGWVAHSTGRGYGSTRLEGIGPTDANTANTCASVMIISVPFLLFYLMKGRKYWHKCISFIFLAFMLDGIILINSRGAFMGLMVCVLYLSYHIFFKGVETFNFKIKAAVGLLLGIVLFLSLTDAVFWERMNTLKDVEVGEDGTLKGAEGGAARTYFWKKGIELVQKYPFGVGAWGYMYLSPQFIPEKMLGRGVGMRAVHSLWFEALTETGYLGFIIFLGYLISTFNLMRKVSKHLLEKKDHYLYYQSIAITASLITFLTASTFINRLYSEMLYWLPAFAACFANIYFIKDHPNNKGKEMNEIE